MTCLMCGGPLPEFPSYLVRDDDEATGWPDGFGLVGDNLYLYRGKRRCRECNRITLTAWKAANDYNGRRRKKAA